VPFNYEPFLRRGKQDNAIMARLQDSLVRSSQRLVAAAHAMVAAAARGRRVVPVLRRLCPHVYQQIVEDRRDPVRLACWGRSVNFDEYADEIIVRPAIVRGIGELAGIPMRGRFVHAGLQHTYGYLFGLIDTPFGPKRNRWLTTDLEKGFAVDASLWGERPKQGTLLGKGSTGREARH
jgi:hypothetical protein